MSKNRIVIFIALLLIVTLTRGQNCIFSDPGPLTNPNNSREVTVANNNLGNAYILQEVTSTNGCDQSDLEANIYTYPNYPRIEDSLDRDCNIRMKD